MTSKGARILIVGAGPVGLILALSLLKNGVPVRIIETSENFHSGTRGPGIMPRTLELEHSLGIVADVKKHAIDDSRIRIYDPNDPHRVIKSGVMIENIPPTPAFPFGTCLTVPQYLHEAVLRKHVESLGGKIDVGVTFVGLQQDETGVAVELAETKNGNKTSEKSQYDWVVGTDGGRSLVRKCMGVAFLGETKEDERMYIADCKVEGLEEQDVHTWGADNQERVVARYTGQPKSFQLVFMGSEKRMALLRTNEKSVIQESVQEITKRTDILVTDIIWQGEWRANIRMAEHFQIGRVLIAGDAAHTHSPAGGQGLNSGAMDAFNLGWKLALVAKDYASSELLKTYELERLPIISEMLKISTGLHNNMQLSLSPSKRSAVPTAKADEGKGASESQSPWFRGRNLFQLDVNYRWSPIVLDERFGEAEAAKQPNAYGIEGHEARAGDRAPDAPNLRVVKRPANEGQANVGEETRLFDVFTPDKHTVLMFASENGLDKTKAILSALEKYPPGLIRSALVLPSASSTTENASAEFVFKDTEKHAYTGFGVKGDHLQVVVVRPDGVIGAFVEGAQGIAKYFSLVFHK